MNGRLALALAVVLAAAGFAGCVETLSFLSASDEVSAQENRELADSAAAAWAGDARLAAVFAFENNNATEEFPSDPEVGNGLSALWFYAYVAENGTKARAFQVSADGEVVAVNESSKLDAGSIAQSGAQPIADWRIDSDEAVEIARGNETFESVAGLEGSSLMEALGTQENVTVWAIMAGSESGQAIAIVDAIDGGLVMVEAFELDFSVPAIPGFPGGSPGAPQVEMSESGTLENQAETEYEFTVETPDSGFLDLRFRKMLPTDGMEWAIVDEEGEAVAEGQYQSLMGMSDGGMEDFEISAPGTYKLVLRHDPEQMIPVGSVDYEVTLVVGGPCSGMGSAPGMDMAASACATSSS